jgi:hypothetical protein
MSLAERLALVSTGSVIEVVGMLALHTDVVNKRDVADFDLLKGPEETHKETSFNKYNSTKILTCLRHSKSRDSPLSEQFHFSSSFSHFN